MDIIHCFQTHEHILMEGALGERLKREYTLSFHDQVAMAALVRDEKGRTALRELWLGYADIARRHSLPFLATTPTRRANRERMAAAGFDEELLRENAAFLRSIREECGDVDMYVGALMGCKGDAYTGLGALTEAEAARFHRWQADALANAGVDFLMAGIMPTLPEAAGMARAMAETGLPYLISFTIRADGRLIDGTSIHDTITYIDTLPIAKPLGYMSNCVHPSILRRALLQSFNRTPTVTRRFLGLQANTSPLSYEALDGAAELHDSPPEELAKEMLRLKNDCGLRLFGGCCGTDQRHMEAIAQQL